MEVALIIILALAIANAFVLFVGWRLARYRAQHHTGTPPEIGRWS